VNTYQNYIGGADVPAADGRTFTAFNPTTGGVWGTFALAGPAEVDRAVQAASGAFRTGPWGRLSPTRRGRLLMKWGDVIAEHADRIATIETEQNGKLFAEMRAQARIAQDWLYYFGGLADKIEGTVIPLDRQSIFNYTLREPLGVVGVITPWNSPTFIAIMSLAPALAAGNTIVLKPASQTPLTALKFAELCQEAGLPEGVVNVVTGPGGKVGMAMVRDPRVDKIAFTGSTEVGKQIMREAAGTLKRLSLELGGKSPNIVFADADMEAAVKGALTGIFYNKGEVCAAGSRLFLEDSIHDAFMGKLTERVKGLTVGDPMDKATRMGPVVSKAQMDTVLSYIEAGKQEGARLVAGGGRASVGNGKGYFIQPTIFDDVRNTMKIAREEIFGPVLSVIPFKSLEEGLAEGNSTTYGLAAAVWTRDVAKALRAAQAIRAGTVWVNAYNLFDAALPFGGFKESGFGREMGAAGLEHYTELKTVWVDLS